MLELNQIMKPIILLALILSVAYLAYGWPGVFWMTAGLLFISIISSNKSKRK